MILNGRQEARGIPLLYPAARNGWHLGLLSLGGKDRLPQHSLLTRDLNPGISTFNIQLFIPSKFNLS